ncbi:zinc carboxypeptidase [Mucilaginibacter daejeonensis]|uniref:M14 family metallopeptidase n=1 Tax=Mucilaginibacter daejeonensis TaxID=398049 RepID=UPI001D170897|nr:M14 family zinc carboxypeptidase [Mucilaginibacter daejeonensis]UEG53041.1 zinc carboxypeptidase [Mucilaginibacter daejeonensis]
MKKLYTLALLLAVACCSFAQALRTPAQFVGYELGSQYTYHYRIAEYFQYMAQASKKIKLLPYGTTNEGRPLMVAFVGSEENLARLDDIRNHNLYLAGLSKAPATLTNAPAIVWLSYNVHGNEPSSSEAAMQTLYDMVDPGNSRTQAWLKNTIVVIDPCLNPDGRDRYVNFYNQVRGVTPDADLVSREHMEPWPGGRVNHYYFDLNRDWAWQTQKEVQARAGLYNQWLPQIHVDFHEQGVNNPYYFAPAAEPFHKDITPWQREFQTTIGKNNAKYFDQNGWLYFTKEVFDLLYPSYGDTYPLYNGSIGMTYEQGGGPAGGLAAQMRSGDTLTLADRIAHHHSNGLSTIETASANAAKILTEYKRYFDNARTNPPGTYQTYVIKNENADNMVKLEQLLTNNRIEYHTNLSRKASGFNYFTGATEGFNVEPKDIVIDAHQPKAVLLTVLLEPKTFVADSNTYDITAWSLPYAYGLKAYGVKGSMDLSGAKPAPGTLTQAAPEYKGAYAYVAEWRSVEDVKFLSYLLQKGVKVRVSNAPFEAAGKKFAAGSLIITRAGNKQADMERELTDAASKYQRKLTPLTTGFSDKGADLGSSAVGFLAKPKVMLVSGEGVSANDMGEVWHFFEQQIGYPVTVVRYQDLERIKLSDHDVMILPDGRYSKFPLERIQDWVNDGGRLIAMGGAISQFADKKGFNLKSKEEDKKEDKNKKPDLMPYADRDRESLKGNVPGAIYKVYLDNTHPLGYGYSKYYYTLKLGDDVYDYLTDGAVNVGVLKKDSYTTGFAGQKAKQKLSTGLLFGVEPKGRGTIIYLADDPLFRSFWEGGKLLFSNAVFMVN